MLNFVERSEYTGLYRLLGQVIMRNMNYQAHLYVKALMVHNASTFACTFITTDPPCMERHPHFTPYSWHMSTIYFSNTPTSKIIIGLTVHWSICLLWSIVGHLNDFSAWNVPAGHMNNLLLEQHPAPLSTVTYLRDGQRSLLITWFLDIPLHFVILC